MHVCDVTESEYALGHPTAPGAIGIARALVFGPGVQLRLTGENEYPFGQEPLDGTGAVGLTSAVTWAA
jgi:hypothetical protein